LLIVGSRVVGWLSGGRERTKLYGPFSGGKSTRWQKKNNTTRLKDLV
jgi:hypothetical protein